MKVEGFFWKHVFGARYMEIAMVYRDSGSEKDNKDNLKIFLRSIL